MLKDAMMEEVHALKADQHHNCGSDSDIIHANTSSHTDGRGHPQACSCGQSLHHILLEDNSTSTNETDTTDHLRCHSGWVTLDNHSCLSLKTIKTVHRQHHEQRRPQSHKKMSAEAGFLGTILALQADGTTQDGTNKNSQHILPSHHTMIYMLLIDES